MSRIQKISSYLVRTISALLIIFSLFFVVRWIYIITKTTDPFLTYIKPSEELINLSTVAWTPILMLLGFTADIISFLPIFISTFILRSIFKNYQKREVFSVRNAILYRRLGVVFLLEGLLTKSLSETLMGLAITLNNPPGHRYLTVSFGTQNLTILFYGIIVIMISWVMLEASRLHDEQKFII